MSYEKPDPQEAYSPKVIPVKCYSNPFYAKVIDFYWDITDKPDVVYLRDAIIPVAESLCHMDLLKLAKLIENDFPKPLVESDGKEDVSDTYRVWQPPKALTVDEGGIVRGIVGKLDDVVKFFYNKDIHEDNTYSREVNDWLYLMVRNAAENHRDEEYAEIIHTTIEREENHRMEANGLKPNIARSAKLYIVQEP